MKTVLPWCGAFALLFLQACGGDATVNPANKPVPARDPVPTPAPAAAAPAAAAPAAAPPASPAPAAQNPAPTKKPAGPVRVNYDSAKQLFGSDPYVAGNDDKKSTPEQVALGKALFHEKHLSKNGDQSCASCHDLASYGQDGKPTSGKSGYRNTPTVWNAARQFAQFWDGRAPNVEEQLLMPALDQVEHGLADEAELVKKLKEKPDLVAGFQKAFPGEADAVSPNNFKLAVGAFERTLVTKSKFDAYLDGDQKALDSEQKLGLKLFMDVGCIVCHTTRLLGGNMFQKTGLLKPYPSEDTGRAKLTGSDADKHFWKVPMLLNVEKTAPYLHDGKVATLEEVVNLMADIQLNKQLKPEEVAAIVAFLKALTGPLPAAN